MRHDTHAKYVSAAVRWLVGHDGRQQMTSGDVYAVYWYLSPPKLRLSHIEVAAILRRHSKRFGLTPHGTTKRARPLGQEGMAEVSLYQVLAGTNYYESLAV